ncbi:TrkH family potassium uptake protein [Deinococcus aerolatus]|uniref:TrkH family potassium uptake protein n=1 Tax=Deinococcus aerolatus TaxID=522487 RepID=UPI00166A33E6|nr:TrkH family potassium uptake protein [Deinococcus aerolatus]
MTRPAAPDPRSSEPSAAVRRRRPLLARLRPPQLIALTFALTILVGTALLLLPVSLEPGQRLSVIQALFMATSAVCVTGLGVVDVGTTFTPFGEVVMLLLIQVGGLGLITLGTLFALALRRRVGITDRIQVAQQVSALELGGVVRLVRTIVLSSVLVELAGTMLLAAVFVPQEGLGRGLYYALFHAVSAFNNAGFSLYATGLTGFVTNPLINVVIPLLIVLGGMGFLVQLNVLAHLRNRRRNRLNSNSKLSLTMMGALLLIGTVGFALLEWNNPATLGTLPLGERLLAAWFQGVTPRTAGFNTLDYSVMGYGTLFLTILLMFIGANPGSTGGGIKTTTFYVMMASAWGMVRGSSDTTLFRRRINTTTILRATTVGLLSLGLVNLGFLLLLLLNTNKDILFVQLFFETISAFATVGLSMNTTPLLNTGQEAVLIVLMFLGRIGPLTFAVAFSRPDSRTLVRYPAEHDILIG